MEAGIRVLLVDDEPLIRKMVKLYLERNGIDVVDAHSGEEAMQVFEREPADIDLVFTDVVMPGFSGRELATRIRRYRPDIPILFMSGYSEQIPDESGGIECMTKPLDLKRLVEIISRVGASSGRLRRGDELIVPQCSRNAGC